MSTVSDVDAVPGRRWRAWLTWSVVGALGSVILVYLSFGVVPFFWYGLDDPEAVRWTQGPFDPKELPPLGNLGYHVGGVVMLLVMFGPIAAFPLGAAASSSDRGGAAEIHRPPAVKRRRTATRRCVL